MSKLLDIKTLEGHSVNKVGYISVLHVIFLSMTVIGLKNHVTIIPSLLNVAGRDSWISVIVSSFVILPWIFLVVFISKKLNGEPVVEWLERTLGNAVSRAVRYAIAIFLLILAVFTLGETLYWITATFLPDSPLVLMLLIYSVLCVLLASTNLQTIVMVNTFVLFWVVVLGFFVAFTNMQVKDYDLLRPFFENGIRPVVTSMVYPASGYVELIMFLFIQHKVKKPLRWYHFSIMLFIIMGLTLGPTTGAITEFGPDEAMKQRFPAYEEWSLVSLGRLIDHMDFLSIYQWLTGAFIRSGVILYVVADLMKMTGDRKRIWSLLAPPFIFMNLALILLNDRIFLAIKGQYLLITTFVFMILLSFFLTLVAILSKRTVKKA